ncbi:hypothetical protein Sipo8835_20850 [Streptomyces ipomoeae]|uniref:Uncharacterized protein n=1 Tax=Streptomyces ipomoeae TaxID=103232 RepID=A0AAE8W218_9ACTN|nr:hypothetical protein Sipo8835_20850 [Streptomyces ipomoeae]TQE35592.1 hypothetical protein Sipo7851_14025 [Streptomyces ipomoeae]
MRRGGGAHVPQARARPRSARAHRRRRGAEDVASGTLGAGARPHVATHREARHAIAEVTFA